MGANFFVINLAITKLSIHAAQWAYFFVTYQ